MRARASWSARGHHRLRWGIGLCLGLLLVPTVGRTGGYPITAFSTSLRLAPELVDETSLLYQLPQRAGLAGSQVFAVNNFYFFPYYGSLGGLFEPFPYSSVPTLGVLGHTHGQSLFLLTQPSLFYSESTMIQVGWGASWSGLRLGLAARNDRHESETLYSLSRQGHENLDTSSTKNELWEGSIGLGVGGDRFGVDVAVDLQRPEETVERQMTGIDTLLLRSETEGDLSTQIAGRFHARFGSSVEVVGAGSWGSLEADLQGVVSMDDTIANYTQPRSLENWSAGLAVSFPAGRLDWFAVSAHWQHREIPSTGYSSVVDSGERKLEQGTLAISLRQQLWKELWGQAGVAARWEETGNETLSQGPTQEYRSRSEERTLRGDFAWGASYAWRYFQARATVSETFDLNDLFVTLDVFVHP